MNLIKDKVSFLDIDSQKSIGNFLRSVNDQKITLVCGAGVSVSAGLPTWQVYLSRITSEFILTWKEMERANHIFKNRAPRSMSINMMGDIYKEFFYPDFSIPESFIQEDPLILAQLIKNCIEPANWSYLLRKALYENYTQNVSSDLLEKIFEIAVHRNVSGIMTYNYDDLIEIFFKSKNIKTSSIVGENYYLPHKYYPIYHLHGILPYKGGLHSKIYLTEDDYLTDIIQPNSWYNQVHTNRLTSTCCLFIGLSFNDPSLKRKLSIHRLSSNAYHYALLTHKDNEYDKKKFLLLKNELLRLNVRVIKYPYDEGHSRISDVLRIIIEEMSAPS